jgi:hypothetical protein
VRSLPGSPTELFTFAAQAPWLGVANSGRGEALLRACQIKIASAWRGIPIILLQSPVEAVRAAA